MPRKQPLAIHLRDIRLANNAGIHFPVCRAGEVTLNLDATRWPLTHVWADVTCGTCRRLALQRYPWAYQNKEVTGGR